jgi:hypothetical protein
VPWRGQSAPKAEASGELADDGDVERYERLRACALAGEPDGHRFGLALLERRGVAAWVRAWQTSVPAPDPTRPAVEPPTGTEQIVGVLAAMALACVGTR